MKLHTLHRRLALCLPLLLVGLCQSVWSAGLTPLWTFESGSLGAGRVIGSVGTVTVGTDGSVGFVVNTHDGAFSNSEYRLYWLDSAMNDLAADDVVDNEWVDEFLDPLAIRKDHFIYQSDQQLRSMTRDNLGDITDVAVGSAFGAMSFTKGMVEQSRNPGVLYIVETASDSLTFKLHAYAITPVNNDELQVPTGVGIDAGEVQVVFPTKADEMYQIQSSVDLESWTDEGAQIIGNGTPRSYGQPVSGISRKFFRVRKL